MSNILQLEVIIFSISMIVLVLYLVNKARMTVKYSLIWLFIGVVMLISAFAPHVVDKISMFLGFEKTSNLVLFMLVGFLIILTLSLTVIVSGQRSKITLLVQEVSLLKKKIEDISNSIIDK